MLVRVSGIPSRLSASPRRASPQVTVRVELVMAPVSVSDAHGNPVVGLTLHNFRVLDGGAERPISFFEPVSGDAHLLVLVETGPAVYLIHTQHLAAAGALFAGLAPNDQVTLVAYDQAPRRLLLPLTADRAALARALGGLEYSLGSGQLNLFGAISAAVDWLAPVSGKKAIVLLSTGLDTGRPGRWESLVEQLRDSDVSIFPVALGGELRTAKPKKKSQAPRSEPGMSFEQADRILNSLAQISGGRVYVPRSAADFAPIYRQVAATLRSQYLLGFQPGLHDGRSHSITVQVFDKNGRPLAPARGGKPRFRIFAREGYQSPAP
jgi:Ca-activated chloride channel family protein